MIRIDRNAGLFPVAGAYKTHENHTVMTSGYGIPGETPCLYHRRCILKTQVGRSFFT